MEKTTQKDDSSGSSCSISLLYPPARINKDRLSKLPIRNLYNTIKDRVEEDLISETSIYSHTGLSDSNISEQSDMAECNDVLVGPPVESVPCEHPTKLVEESRSLQENKHIENLPQGMSWLLESGRKKLEQFQSQESQGKVNIQSKSVSISTMSSFDTPAKGIHHSSYITPQNKNQFTFCKETPAGCLDVIKDLPASWSVSQDKENIEFPHSCNKLDPVYINDSGVVVSSFYSHTKSTRSVAITSDYSNHKQNNWPPTLLQQDEYNKNPVSSHSLVARHPIKRLALHEKFTSFQENVIIQEESKIGKQLPSTKEFSVLQNQPQHPKPSHHYYFNEDKENNINIMPLDLSDKVYYHCNDKEVDNLMALDLSDKMKELKPVDKRKESVPKVLQYKTSADMEHPINLKLHKTIESGLNMHRSEGSTIKPAIPPTTGQHPYKVHDLLRTPAPLKLPVESVVTSAQRKVAPNNYKSSNDSRFDVNHPMEVQSSTESSFQVPKPATKQVADSYHANVYCQQREMKPTLQPPKLSCERSSGLLKSNIPCQSNKDTLDMDSILNSRQQSDASLIVKNKVYTIMSELGRGGSSVVHQVLDRRTNKQLAIKCVHLAGVDKESAQGYLNEIKLLEKLQNCDCVIKLCDYEYVQHTQTLYVVMEKGDTDFSKLLKEISKTKKISSLMIAYYWAEMVNAVKCIHENGIIHSDLKPANFLLVSGRLKLIDFGIASSLNVDSTSVVKENILGTFNYISPEAIQGPTQMPETRKISFKSDIWSLGCILYNLVYGRTPFAHIVHNMTKLCAITNKNHRIGYPESAECPEIFLVIMKSCLQYRPIDRPSAEELLRVPFLPTLQVPCVMEQNMVDKIRSKLLPDEWEIVEKLLPKERGDHTQIRK